jgi:uracil-DNA glycosylase
MGRMSIPGDDYAIAEIVRCKSKSERGVKAATHECVENYLDHTIEFSGAKIIICLGKKVKSVIEDKYKPQIISPKSDDKENEICQIQIGSRKIMLLFLPHPNARQERNVYKIFGDKLNLIRNSLL